MDIQAKVWKGYAKAALRLGQTYTQYRPSSASNPISAQNLVGSVIAAFDDKPNYQFKVPNLYGHPEKFVLLDGSLVQVGDYLTNGTQTLFIAVLEPLLPIVCMQCNVVASVLRPASNAGVGAQPYGGDAAAAEIPILTAWPAWIAQGTKGERGDTILPGDVRMPWEAIMLPSFPGAVIETADVMTDNLGRRYKVSSAELTAMGWRLTAMLAET